MARDDVNVHIEGLAEFRRDLRSIDRALPREVNQVIKSAVGRVAAEASRTAPRQSGTLAGSYRPFTRGNIAGVTSRLPYAPVIEYGPLSDWKDIAGAGQEMQDVFWYIKEAIDAYYDGRPFQVTVKAGCLIGRKHEPRPLAPEAPMTLPALEDDSFEDIDTGLPIPPHKIAVGSVRVADPDDFEVVEEVADDGSFDIEMDVSAEADLDAFIEGKKRPSHLDD